MASSGWRTNSNLSTLVATRYDRFNVFQLMRVLSHQLRIDANGQPEGEWPFERRLRFRADLSGAFPGQEISKLMFSSPDQAKQSGKPALPSQLVNISTPNYSVASTLGPLPDPFTEWVRDLERAREPAMADFLNIFNQRFNQLRFEIKMHQILALNQLSPEETQHASYLAAFMGLGQPNLSKQVPLPPRAWLGLAGLLSNRRKSAYSISQVLTLFLKTPVTLTPLIGAWHTIKADACTRLGKANHQLGQRSMLGHRVWDQQARIRLSLTALTYPRFCQLLPALALLSPSPLLKKPLQAPSEERTPTPFEGFRAMLRLLMDRLHDCEVALQLDDKIPLSTLTAKPDLSSYWGLRLGQTAWLDGRAHTNSQVPLTRTVTYLIPAFDPAESV